MNEFNSQLLKQLYVPAADSHKGQNGKLLIIAGSKLFHAASLWPLTVASRMVDMVFYSSVPENNQLVQNAKEEFRNGIVVSREQLDHYIKEADAILIGPGLMRSENHESRIMKQELSLNEINKLADEGEQTYYLTKYLINNFPDKKIVFDGGALQMMEPEWLLKMKQMPIVTPHQGELEMLFKNVILERTERSEGVRLLDRRGAGIPESDPGHLPAFATQQALQAGARMTMVFGLAKKYNSVILLKGVEDVVASPSEIVSIPGGNAGMTKGGTGDVLAGLVASLYCKNDAFISATCGSYINKKAGESLEKSVGIYFNASDLASEIPKTLAQELNH